jgi:hypothetical protein
VPLVRNRAIGDALISVGSLGLLIAMLASFDERVRQHLTMSFEAGRPTAQLANAEATVRNLASIVFVAARDQGIEHAPLVIFVIAAVVLILFMLRT